MQSDSYSYLPKTITKKNTDVKNKEKCGLYFLASAYFYEDILSLAGSWYGLFGGTIELAHKITAGKADRGCSPRAYLNEEATKGILIFFSLVKERVPLRSLLYLRKILLVAMLWTPSKLV